MELELKIMTASLLCRSEKFKKLEQKEEAINSFVTDVLKLVNKKTDTILTCKECGVFVFNKEITKCANGHLIAIAN